MSLISKKFIFLAVVLALLLAAIALPAVLGIKRLARDDNARFWALQLVHALQNFYHDHNAYPLISPYGDHIGIADAELVHALTGTNPIINPDNTVYIQPHPDTLSPDDAFIDPWGTPYHVHIDTTFNRRVPNPQPNPDRPEIPTTVLVYSAGPDRDPTTWNDNITSWD